MNKVYKRNKHIQLNLGGGERMLKGYINLDILPLKGVDLVCNLNQGIPLKSNSVSKIIGLGILEHLDSTVNIMEEIYRVCCDGANVFVTVPYYKSIGAFKDPTHKSFFTEETFTYFSSEERAQRNLPNYGIKAEFKVLNISYYWSPWIGPLPFKKFMMRFLWNIARTMFCSLEVIKK